MEPLLEEDITYIHYWQLPDNKKITADHVRSIVGYMPNKTEEEMKEYLTTTMNDWNSLKTHLRNWAAVMIKDKIQYHLQLPENVIRLSNGLPVKKFADITKWWMNCSGSLEDIRIMKEIQFEIWEKDKQWERRLEKEWMNLMVKSESLTKLKWCYTESSQKQAELEGKRPGFQPKGCVAKNIANVKYNLVKLWQKRAGETGHGIMVAKRRMKEETYDQNGKYKKFKGEHKAFIKLKIKVRGHNKKLMSFMNQIITFCPC